MCSKCKTVLIGWKGGPHPTKFCPVNQSSYCGICASYGHTVGECPDDAILAERVPRYVEQLIPASLMATYDIKTRTPLPTVTPQTMHEPVLEVKDLDKDIRAILLNYNIQPSGKKKELRHQIKRLSDDLKRKLVFIK
jgi:hypothetical protein